MKRLFILCLFIILLLACGTDPSAVTPVPTAEAEPVAQPTQEEPSADAVMLVHTAAPTATPEPTEEPTPEPTEIPTPTPEPTPDMRFTFVWASDTQTMIGNKDMRDDYLAVCDWIAKEADARRFVLFIHSGDMVSNGDIGSQWTLFLKGVDAFRDKVPFFWALGNHEEGYQHKKPWKDRIYPEGVPPEQVYGNGFAWYRLFEKDETRLLLLSVQYWMAGNPELLEWARGVCLAHPDLPVILVTHQYLTAEGGLADRAANMESLLVAACPNIRLILCGHARGISRAVFTYDDDGDGVKERTVNALMYDIQTELERYGYLCLLTYDPNDNTLSVNSYSPLWDDYIYDDEHPELEQFVLYDVF